MNYSEYKKSCLTIHSFLKEVLSSLKYAHGQCARTAETRVKKLLSEFKNGMVVQRHNYLTVWFNIRIQLGYIKTDIDCLIKEVNPQQAKALQQKRKSCLVVAKRVNKAIIDGTCVGGGIQ